MFLKWLPLVPGRLLLCEVKWIFTCWCFSFQMQANHYISSQSFNDRHDNNFYGQPWVGQIPNCRFIYWFVGWLRTLRFLHSFHLVWTYSFSQICICTGSPDCPRQNAIHLASFWRAYPWHKVKMSMKPILYSNQSSHKSSFSFKINLNITF